MKISRCLLTDLLRTITTVCDGVGKRRQPAGGPSDDCLADTRASMTNEAIGASRPWQSRAGTLTREICSCSSLDSASAFPLPLPSERRPRCAAQSMTIIGPNWPFDFELARSGASSATDWEREARRLLGLACPSPGLDL